MTTPALWSVTWATRLVAIVLVGVLTFVTAPPTGVELTVELVGYAVCVLVMAYWLATELPALPSRAATLQIAMGLMAAVAGVLAMARHGGAFVGFSFITALAAGADTSWLAGWVIAAIAVLSIEVGGLISSTDTAEVWAYPLLLIVSFIGGRNRRAYLVQAEQSAALVGQLEALRAEQRQVAVLDERNRIAREIHDVLAHSLGALGIQLQLTRAVLHDQDMAGAQKLLEQAQRMATDGLADTRRAVQALRGDSTRLDEQLAGLVGTHRERHSADIDFVLDGQPEVLSPEANVALIRTAQEALVNSAKHAPGQPVGVRLSYRPEGVALAITNPLPTADAVTADAAASGSVNGGYGLLGMRERLLLINGTLAAGPGDHQEWTVVAQVPR